MVLVLTVSHKEDVAHIYNGISLSYKKDGIMLFAAT